MRKFCLFVCLVLGGCSSSSKNPIVYVSPAGKTHPVPGDTDDCAIWIHPTDPSLSLIIGNDRKGEGGLYGWDLKGHLIFYYGPLLKPVNVDIRYGFTLGNEKIDILVVGTHADNTLHVFKIDPILRNLVDITIPGGIKTQAEYQLYGLSLYQNPTTGEVSAFVSEQKNRKPIRQIALKDVGNGQVGGEFIRQFGELDIKSMVKGMYADDELGYLYCCDQNSAVLKYYADPAQGNQLIDRFATIDEDSGELEAVAVYRCPNLKGYLLLSSLGNHEIRIYDRNNRNEFLMTVKKRGVTRTDGMEVSSCPVGLYPHGFVICHDKESADFVLYNWDDIAGSELNKCTCVTGY